MKKKIIAILIPLLLIVILIVSCNQPTTEVTDNQSSSEPVADNRSMQEKLIDCIDDTDNYDIVAWLNIPNTPIDDAVLQSWDNLYYEGPADEYKNYDPFGVYYADYRNDLLNGRDMLSSNTIIYGHSDYKDDPTTDGKRFSKLYYYNDFNFLKQNPYILFSEEDEDMVFQVFAVFYACVDKSNPNYFYYWAVPEYDSPSEIQQEKNATMEKLISDAKKRSEYIIELDVTPEDKILTLSTCTGKYNGHLFTVPDSGYENYRYVVMAKLIDGTEIPEKCDTQMIINPNPLRS